MNILVVGGTGPSGPYLLESLLAAGHDVTILHRGVHEPPDLPEVAHIHGDPHFTEPLTEALGGRSFDVVFGLYGRLGVLAEVFAGRCDRFITVGGRPIYAGYLDPSTTFPRSMRIWAAEDSPLADPETLADERLRKFISSMRRAEDAVFANHAAGRYRATLFRYPYIYGPRALGTVEWSVVKRVLDGRTTINLPDNGLILNHRLGAKNAAHHLVLAMDSETAWGEIFNCADDLQFSLAQWVELLAAAMGAHLEIVDVPAALRWTVSNFLFFAGTAADISTVDTTKAKRLLGYADVLNPLDAVVETVEWYRRNPVDWENQAHVPDRFDYALEDEVAAALAGLTESFASRRPELRAVHTYAHPKESSLTGDERGR